MRNDQPKENLPQLSKAFPVKGGHARTKILNTLKIKLIMDGLLYKTKEHLTNWGYGFPYIFVLFILPVYYQVFWVFQVFEHVYRAPSSITAT